MTTANANASSSERLRLARGGTWLICVLLGAATLAVYWPVRHFEFLNYDDNDGIVHILSGQITGTVYVWTPRKGFSEVPGTELSGDNGLLASKDGHWLFVNDFGRKRVYKAPLDRSGEITHVDTDFRPDNLRWGPDGKIIATGQFVDLNNRNDLHGWAAVKIDTETMKAEPYLKVAGTAAFDNGTTTLPVGKSLYIGTYRGDRVMVIAAP